MVFKHVIAEGIEEHMNVKDSMQHLLLHFYHGHHLEV